ncbi:MAG TPA: hypothetical protein VEK08_15660 [Planctomycetota bacterium]|nr:hypothetical protein [Planctomycetota bacterium]
MRRSAAVYNRGMRVQLIIAGLCCCGLISAGEDVPSSVAASLRKSAAVQQCFEVLGLQIDGPGFDRNEQYTRVECPFVLSTFRMWREQPLRAIDRERHLRDFLIGAKLRSSEILSAAANLLDADSCRFLIDPKPIDLLKKHAESDGALLKSLVRLHETCLAQQKKHPSLFVKNVERLNEKKVREKLTGVPPVVQRAAALILAAVNDAVLWREAAFRNAPPELLEQVNAQLLREEDDDKPADDKDVDPRGYTLPADMREAMREADLARKVDFNRWYAGLIDLSSAVDMAAEWLAKEPSAETYRLELDTPLGRVVLCGGREDEYRDGAHLLLVIDTAGNDSYHTGAASSGLQHPFSVIIDTAGNDRYTAPKGRPSQGTGVFGFGMLVDLAGDDSYSAEGSMAQGAGLFGAGVLCDWSGDDTFSCDGFGQGAGMYGVGILLKGGGNDKYRLFQSGQGFGCTLGAGILIDRGGNDSYVADDTTIKYPSAQTKEHNASCAQGAGFGQRRDYIDGVGLAGGVGMLLDLNGDDSYSGGVFSQAVGYLYGIGILDDRAGKDSYRGVWYAQSATAHDAFSLLAEGGGDDTYSSAMYMRLGAAHDFSTSIFFEEGGNDKYPVEGGGFGYALHNSLGLFLERGGDDQYTGALSSMAAVSGDKPGRSRGESPTWAAFIDFAGADVYAGKPDGNNSTHRPKVPHEYFRSIVQDVDEK